MIPSWFFWPTDMVPKTWYPSMKPMRPTLWFKIYIKNWSGRYCHSLILLTTAVFLKWQKIITWRLMLIQIYMYIQQWSNKYCKKELDWITLKLIKNHFNLNSLVLNPPATILWAICNQNWNKWSGAIDISYSSLD